MQFVTKSKNTQTKTVQLFWMLILCSIIIQMSCQKKSTENCSSTEQAFIGKVDGIKSGNVNQEIPFTVYFGLNNGCGKYGTVIENISGNTRTISVNATYIGCACTLMAGVISTNYIFKTTQAGTYYLKFLQGNNTFITDTLIIQ